MIYFFSVGKQSDCDLVWSLSILVVTVIPSLASRYIDCLRCMGIRYHISRCCISCYFTCITFNFFLFDRVLDLLSALVLIKVCEASAPVFCFCQRQLFSGIFSIRIQMYGYIFRSLSVLVISIIPCLGHTDAYLARFITVRDVISIYCRCVVSYRILCNRICDLSSCFILRQVFEAPAPVFFLCYFFIRYLCSICKQSDCDLVWSLSILVVTVIPSLASRYIDCLRCMGIRYHISRCCISCNGCCVFVYRILCNRICNLSSCFILRQVLEAPAPVFFLCYFFIRYLCSICKQSDFDTLRSLSILVIRIIPNLSTFYIH